MTKHRDTEDGWEKRIPYFEGGLLASNEATGIVVKSQLKSFLKREIEEARRQGMMTEADAHEKGMYQAGFEAGRAKEREGMTESLKRLQWLKIAPPDYDSRSYIQGWHDAHLNLLSTNKDV